MKTNHLHDNLYVSAQLSTADLKTAKAEGFDVIINNRPDGEETGQPRSATLEKHTQALGMDYIYLPVISGKLTEENVQDFGRVMAKTKGKTLAFCRTGTRSATLWAKSQSGKLAPDEIISAASEAGYNLSGLKGELNPSSSSSASSSGFFTTLKQLFGIRG